MEEELRLSLLLLGGFFILGVLAHGLWNIRKNSQAKKTHQRVEPEAWEDETDDNIAEESSRNSDFDEFGIGEVRVIRQAEDANETPKDELFGEASGEQSGEVEDTPKGEADEPAVQETQDEEPSASDSAKVPEAEKLYASVVSNPKPQFNRDSVVEMPDSVPAPPSFLLKEQAESEKSEEANKPQDDFSLDAQTLPDSPKAEPVAKKESDNATKTVEGTPEKKSLIKKRSKTSGRKRQEPKFGDDEQMQIDFDESAKAESAQPSTPVGNPSGNPTNNIEPEVLILNVRAPEDAPISGASLLPMLLTLGFKFGDQDIFHRHVNSNGKGPVLFSLANMFKPGNFDIDNLETFTTRGVSLFMLLPIEGDPHQVFNMMHNAARKIADEFNAQVLDGRRSVLTKQGLQQYVEKIRDFERKRMIARH